MAVGEKQALEPQPTIADNRQRVARAQRCEERRGGAGAGHVERAPPRALTDGGWMGWMMLRRDRARWWEGVEGESARTPRNDCVYSILYVHTCLLREIPTLRRRSGSRPSGQQPPPPPPSMLPATLPYITPPRPSVNAAVGQSWQRPGRVVGGER